MRPPTYDALTRAQHLVRRNTDSGQRHVALIGGVDPQARIAAIGEQLIVDAVSASSWTKGVAGK